MCSTLKLSVLYFVVSVLRVCASDLATHLGMKWHQKETESKINGYTKY